VKPLLIIGSANVDFIMRVGKLPTPGETVTDGEFVQTFGGKGANQAVAAARAGGKAGFIACLGQDPYAPIMMENFRRDGLDVSGIRQADDVPSGSALVMIGGEGMNYLTVAPGSNYALRPDDIRERGTTITSAGAILLQMEIPVETNLAAIELASAAGIPVILNYAPARLIEPQLLANLDTLIVNESEAAALVGIEPHDEATTRRAAAALAALGARRVVITLGAKGCHVLDGDKEFHCPSFPVTAVDSTAAGDTFCGTFAVALLEGRSMPEALSFASAAAAISVTRLGAQPSIPRRVEIEAFLASFPPA
jgi:ribokinase